MSTSDANCSGTAAGQAASSDVEAALLAAADGRLPADMRAYKEKNGIYTRRRFSASFIGYGGALALTLPILAVAIHAAIMRDADGLIMCCILLFPFMYYLTTRHTAVVFRPESGQVTLVGFLGLWRRRFQVTPAFRVQCADCAIHLCYPGKSGKTRRYRLASADVWTENLLHIARETRLLLAASVRDHEYARSMAADPLPEPIDTAPIVEVPEPAAGDSSLSRPAVPERSLPFPAVPYVSKTLVVKDNRVVFISPFSWFVFLLFTIPYVIIMYLIASVLYRDWEVVKVFGSVWNSVAGWAFTTAVWWYFIRACVFWTEFDLADQRARSHAFLWFVKCYSFEELDCVSRWDQETTNPNSGFILTRKCDPEGTGRLISTYYSPGDAELAYLEETVVPMLNSRLREVSNEREAAYARGEMPENLHCYQLVGSRFIASRPVAVVISVLLAAYCVYQGLFVPHEAYMVGLCLAIAFWTYVYVMHMAVVVVLDLDAGKMTAYRWLGLNRTVIPFERFVDCGFVTTRWNTFYVGTTLMAQYFDADGNALNCPLKFSRYLSGLGALQRETTGIIAAARVRKALGVAGSGHSGSR